jgi:hypothetical protein
MRWKARPTLGSFETSLCRAAGTARIIGHLAPVRVIARTFCPVTHGGQVRCRCWGSPHPGHSPEAPSTAAGSSVGSRCLLARFGSIRYACDKATSGPCSSTNVERLQSPATQPSEVVSTNKPSCNRRPSESFILRPPKRGGSYTSPRLVSRVHASSNASIPSVTPTTAGSPSRRPAVRVRGYLA